MERQEILVRDPAPSLHFIIDEAVIRRVAGGRDVMRRQLRQLLEFSEQENMTLRIVPFEKGLYRRQRLPYWLFEFPDPEDGDVLYVENPRGEYFIRESSPEEEEESSPVQYLEVFWELEQIARREETPTLLQDAINRLGS
jgi:hypothetical protein